MTFWNLLERQMDEQHDVVRKACVESSVRVGVVRAYEKWDAPSESELTDCIIEQLKRHFKFWFEQQEEAEDV